MDFEQRHQTLFLSLAAIGTIPPGLNKLIKSKLVCAMLIVYSWTIFIASAVLTVWLAFFFVVYCRSMDVFLAVFRRWIAVFHLSFKMGLNVLRLGTLQWFFDDWNNDELLGVDYKRREQLFNAALGNNIVPIVSSMTIFAIGTQGLTYRAAFQPYQLWPSLRWAPHEAAGRYRDLYHLLEAVSNASVVTASGCEVIRILLLLMLLAQVQNLKEHLGTTVDSIPESKIGAYEETVTISTWVKAHQRTLRWAYDLKRFFAMELANKYLFLGVYSCLAAFCAPRWLKTNNISFLFGIALFGIGYFSFLFLSSKIVDEITETSERLFERGYYSKWHMLSPKNHKTMLIISTYTTRRPIHFFAFGLFAENRKFFGDILVMAFRTLSVLLQMLEE